MCMVQGGACLEAFFGEIDTGSGLLAEGRAPLIPSLTLCASLKQSIGRSNLGTYRYEIFPGHLTCCTAIHSHESHLLC